MTVNTHTKLTHLRRLLQDMGSVAIAFSGGVDSTLLLKVAYDELGDQVLAILAKSPSQPQKEQAAARALANYIGARLVELESHEMDNPDYVANTPDRCYVCKGHMCDLLQAYAQTEGYYTLLDGANAHDAHAYRPGSRAARERGVRSPLQEVGLTKAEIRTLARDLGLPNWDKPAAACLATRIPYQTPITLERLHQVEQAEQLLRDLGLHQVRVRHHGAVARIEIEPSAFDIVLKHRKNIVNALRELGFTYIALDLAGFRSGSMNEVT